MSRTLGFIAGLTVPAGLYYISVVHLQGTTKHISDELHQQSLRLNDPTKSEPVILEPRPHDTFQARIRQGWNDGIERGVRTIQETDWQETAKKTGYVVSNLSKTAWDKLQPTIEDGKDAVHDLAEASKDAALHAGQAVGAAAQESGQVAREIGHKLSAESRELAHEVNVQGSRMAQNANVEAHRLAKVAREDTREAGQYLSKVEKEAESTFSAWKTSAAKKAEELAAEARQKSHEAGVAMGAMSDRMKQQAHELRNSADDLAHQGKQAASDASEAARDSAKKVEKKAQSSLAAAQMKASEEWILAQDRYERLLSATEQKADMKYKELLEQVGNRRIGFTSVNDPSGAAKQVKAAENYNKKAEVPAVQMPSKTKTTESDAADLLQTTALE